MMKKEEDTEDSESLLLNITQDCMLFCRRRKKFLGRLCVKAAKLFMRTRRELSLDQAAVLLRSELGSQSHKIQIDVNNFK